MTEPACHQEPEGSSAGAIWLVAGGVVAISAALIVVAWLLVVPPPAAARAVAAPSPLEHGLIDHAAGGGDLNAAGLQRLERTEWIDRAAGVVRIPIDRAIDAVVADPRLITAPHAGSASVTLAREPAETSAAPTAALGDEAGR